jgi:DNA modification methylase
VIELPTDENPVVVVEGDAQEVLPTLPDGFCDHVITDPPYAEKTHAGARCARPGVGLTVASLVTFDSIGDSTFLDLCEHCVRVADR